MPYGTKPWPAPEYDDVMQATTHTNSTLPLTWQTNTAAGGQGQSVAPPRVQEKLAINQWPVNVSVMVFSLRLYAVRLD